MSECSLQPGELPSERCARTSHKQIPCAGCPSPTWQRVARQLDPIGQRPVDQGGSCYSPQETGLLRQREIAEMVSKLDSSLMDNEEALGLAVAMRNEGYEMDTADIIHLAISRRSKIDSIEDATFLQRNLTEHAALLDAVGRTYEADVLRNILDGYALYTANGGNPVEQNPPPSQEVPPSEGKVMIPKN